MFVASVAVRSRARVAVLLAFLASAGNAHAGMQLDRTRVIVPAAEGKAALHVQSEDPQPLLLQMWVDDGTQTDPAALRVPFITDPPVMLLAPGARRAVQVLRVDAPDTLPAGRESLYWLNVLEVPANAPVVAQHHGQLQMSVQSRLKLFYRPRALAHYDAATLPADEQLRFTRQIDHHGQRWLLIDNPAPIHQTLATLSVHLHEAKPIELDAPMLAPFGQARLALPAVMTDASQARLHFATISDNGTLVPHEQTLPSPLLPPPPPRMP